MKECLNLRNGLPPLATNLEQLKLVICDEERAKFWEPIKEVLTILEGKEAEKDINLTSQTMISKDCFFLENFVGFVKLSSLSSTLCFFFLTFRTY